MSGEFNHDTPECNGMLHVPYSHRGQIMDMVPLADAQRLERHLRSLLNAVERCNIGPSYTYTYPYPV